MAAETRRSGRRARITKQVGLCRNTSRLPPPSPRRPHSTYPTFREACERGFPPHFRPPATDRFLGGSSSRTAPPAALRDPREMWDEPRRRARPRSEPAGARTHQTLPGPVSGQPATPPLPKALPCLPAVLLRGLSAGLLTFDLLSLLPLVDHGRLVELLDEQREELLQPVAPPLAAHAARGCARRPCCC